MRGKQSESEGDGRWKVGSTATSMDKTLESPHMGMGVGSGKEMMMAVVVRVCINH